MPEFKLQRFRGGWAIASYDGGKRISRCRLEAGDEKAARREFDGVVAGLNRKPTSTVAQLWSAYQEDRAGRVIAGNMLWSGKAILPKFGSLKPNEITTQRCREYVASRRSWTDADGKEHRRNDGTIWTELGHLRTVLAWAEKTGLIDRAPAIERPEQPAPRERFFTRDEVEALLDGAKAPHIRLFILLAIGTGGRNAALLELRWSRVDFDRGIIDLRKSDIGRAKGRGTPPMNDTLRAALLEAHAARRTDFVIEWAGEPVKKIRRGLAKAAEGAKLDGVTPHVFRHSAAVWMAEGGVSMSEIAEFLGHSDSRLTERVYARFSPTHLRKAAAFLSVGAPRSALRFK